LFDKQEFQSHMVKKTSRPTKTTQQRAKEEQWRKRMNAQAHRTSGGAIAPLEPEYAAEDALDGANAVPAAPRPRSSTATLASSPRTQSGTAAAQRRTMAATRTQRNRLAAQGMTIEEEMHYVRNDIRRLIILTVICMVVIIILAFVIPS
jgi:hypothetical protein